MADPTLREIGWKEWIAFPEWDLRKVKAKIDTGAKTSAISGTVESIRERSDGTRVATLGLRLSHRQPSRLTRVQAVVVRSVQVRNSGGEQSSRFVVETIARLGTLETRIEFTVADRTRMLTPIILGRRAIQNRFVVDVSRKFVLPG